MTDSIFRDLHWINQNAAGRIGMDKPVANPHTRDTFDNDLTYFIIQQLEVIKKAIIALHEHLERKAAELQSIEKRLDGSALQGQLNHRQLAILRHAMDHPNAIYSIQEHQAAHNISYQTARTDLLKLSEQFKILSKRKYGNAFVFVAPPDLGQKLADAEPLSK